MKTVPSDSLFAILAIPRCDDYATYIAANTAIRLTAIGKWKAKNYGDSKILDLYNIKLKCIDACISTIDFDKNFSISIPERAIWRGPNPLTSFDIRIFTDGSKTETGCGAGFYIENTNIRYSYRLSDSSSVFQGEVFAISMACATILQLHENLSHVVDGSSIVICVDSQAGIKALAAYHTSSTLVKQCKELLKKVEC